MARNLELKVPPVAVVLLVAAAMWLIARLTPTCSFALIAATPIAVIVALLGMTIAALGVVEFRRAKTTVNPMKPEAASAFVASGIYRFTRNPMYLGGLLVLIAWALFLHNALSVLVVPAFVSYMNCFQIEPEERILRARFGAAFTSYRARVRRWL